MGDPLALTLATPDLAGQAGVAVRNPNPIQREGLNVGAGAKILVVPVEKLTTRKQG